MDSGKCDERNELNALKNVIRESAGLRGRFDEASKLIINLIKFLAISEAIPATFLKIRIFSTFFPQTFHANLISILFRSLASLPLIP